MGEHRPQRRRGSVVALLALVALASACGSRLSHDEHLSVAGLNVQADGAGGAGTADGLEVGTGSAADTVPGSGGAAGATEQATGGSGGASTGGSSTGGDAQGTSGGGTATPAKGAPIKVGVIGNFGGIAGAAFNPARDAFKAWVAMTNAKGGIKGHPIEVVYADDGNEGSRDLALAKDFVENRKVIALVNYFGANGGSEPVARYAESKNIPVIGGIAIEPAWFNSPMMFPQITGPENRVFADAMIMGENGMNKIAIVYCTEGAVCKDNADRFAAAARAQGLEIVYSAGISLAQPDFTSECLNARSAGANAVYPQADGNSVNRMARSCSRQNFKPKFYVPAPVEPPDPLIEGAVSAIPSFPWTLETGSPAIEEYARAIKQYAPNITKNSWITAGWLSGKLLEAAAANVSATPTSQDLLEGLWALKGNTLGGIGQAFTFNKGKPAPQPNCAFFMQAKGGKWVAPLGPKLVGCR